MIKVVVADDQTLIAEGLKLLLSREPDIEVVGLAGHGLEAIRLVESLQPDVLLLDIRMPELDGVETIRRLKDMGETVNIIILTTFDDDRYIHEGMSLGAKGYLLKDATPSQIAEAIRVVAGGSLVMTPAVTARLFQPHEGGASGEHSSQARVAQTEACLEACFKDLTERERDIVALIAEGKSNLEISETLFLTEGTVKNHISRILSKCGLRDRTQLAVLWLKGH